MIVITARLAWKGRITLSHIRLLHQLAALNGIQSAYYDVNRKRQVASQESLLATLRVLGSPVNTLTDVPSALREHHQTTWRQLLEPVIVAWNGKPPTVELRLPSKANAHLDCYLELETGEKREWRTDAGSLQTLENAEIEGSSYLKKSLQLPSVLPSGYHRLRIEVPEKSEEALIIAAPLKAYLPPQNHRDWGVFLPLYAVHRQDGPGCGNYTDLAELTSWVSGMGGSMVGTLPFLPVFLDHPFDPSPYLPVSRLMWNEFYIDVTKVPELQKCPQAQATLASAEFNDELANIRGLPTVDYFRLMSLKRRVLEELCRCLFSADLSSRLDELRRFAENRPLIEQYARFRATCEKQRSPWQSWPQTLQKSLKEGDYDEESRRYHLYAQWLAHQQVEAVAETAGNGRGRLFLDLPLGSHPDGFDSWHWQELFVRGCSVGAPPDAVFTSGQDWSFPPQHPEKRRKMGYRYYIECLRHHCRHARLLRIDHMMGFHRLFWIPHGMEVSDGVYVRYHAEELYALVTLESHRNKTMVVGEDLGTVPSYVRPAMSLHGLLRMYVVQYELEDNRKRAMRPVPANALASLNTHDMPTFAAYWQGLDLQQRVELGVLRREDIPEEKKRREMIKSAVASFLRNKGLGEDADITDIIRAILDFLSASRARVLLVNLEDLWQELLPQNVPGSRDRCNWCRKARYPFEVFSHMPEVVDALKRIDRIRKGE